MLLTGHLTGRGAHASGGNKQVSAADRWVVGRGIMQSRHNAYARIWQIISRQANQRASIVAAYS
jgi:hypothetical protein